MVLPLLAAVGLVACEVDIEDFLQIVEVEVVLVDLDGCMLA